MYNNYFATYLASNIEEEYQIEQRRLKHKLYIEVFAIAIVTFGLATVFIVGYI